MGGIDLQAAVKEAKHSAFKDPSKYCRDMCGRRHNLEELREQRFKAVMKGMSWMRKFLQKDKYAALHDIGDDAPSIFFEVWYTSADSRIRVRARGIAVELLVEYVRGKKKQFDKAMRKHKDEGAGAAGGARGKSKAEVEPGGSRREKTAKAAKASKAGKGKHDNADGGDDDLSIDNFFEYMFLIRSAHEMELEGEEDVCPVLMHMADETYKRLNLRNTDALFGTDVEALPARSTDTWLLLLMRILIMEFNKIIYMGKWPISWGLKEALLALKQVELSPPPYEKFPDFHDSVYLATHIVFAFSAYSSIKTTESECKWLYDYCRVALRYWMRNDRRNRKMEVREARALAELELEQENKTEEEDAAEAVGEEARSGDVEGAQASEVSLSCPASFLSAGKLSLSLAVSQGKRGGHPTEAEAEADGEPGGRGIRHFVDVDGVAEAVDVLRGSGLTEGSDALLCEGCLFLLRVQSKDGQFPVVFQGEETAQSAFGDDPKGKKKGYYDRIHATWVATQALRDRDYKIERKGNVRWKEWITRLLKEVEFNNLEYEPKWKCDLNPKGITFRV
ncbi:hypothetical protein CYMTET_51491 [Cymbomonas tetramitiformis]|uniref:Uncharacterized protein n=1 Tax=Cymbomonas tetramitiformis TaxID=36881 RepID=A0AAE0BL28_9CHLO|nr:hypothetical protein CYMTET_51491 [Cymbomonas tetramitiformis]